MSLVVVGVNHRTAAVDLLERMTVPPGALPKALHALAGREHLAEVVLLSTCNRTEVYARTTRFHRLERILSGRPFWIRDRYVQLGCNPRKRRGGLKRFI